MPRNEISRVFLIGAGPGDPELLTLKAARLLEAADVVLHDSLVDPRILAAAPRARLIDVGKRCGRHAAPQQEICRLLVEEALAGHVVVRLKGGDPMVFGRATEEMDALRAQGIGFDVVPGVTARHGRRRRAAPVADPPWHLPLPAFPGRAWRRGRAAGA